METPDPLESCAIHPTRRAGVPGPASAPDVRRHRVDVGRDCKRLDLVTMHVGTCRGAIDRVEQRIELSGLVRLAKQGEGFVIDRIALTLKAAVPGIDETRFQAIALAAKAGCPLSKALASVPEVTLQATLQPAA